MAGNFHSENPVLFEGVSNVTATPSVGLGFMRVYNGEVYEYVYAVGAINKGYGTTYSGTSGHSVLATGIVSGEYCAGYCKHATIPAASYGWLLKKGVVDALNGTASSAPADGDVVYLAADGAFHTGRGQMATAATDFIGGHVLGKVLSAGASGGTGASFSLIYVNVV